LARQLNSTQFFGFVRPWLGNAFYSPLASVAPSKVSVHLMHRRHILGLSPGFEDALEPFADGSFSPLKDRKSDLAVLAVFLIPGSQLPQLPFRLFAQAYLLL
jgi:hypothetical protein